jgi:predicted short-subunit dehydrogenase-like oxidoreductase (DUF2520 family)
MKIALVGPGRAGQAVAIAANGAGHDVAAVAARDVRDAEAAARRFDAVPLSIGDPIPPVDLVVIAVRDDAIGSVAGQIAPIARNAAGGVAHLSGAVSISALSPFSEHGMAVGSFHPLQTLPTPTLGARRLAGSWIAVTATGSLREDLYGFARSMGCHPFDLDDAVRTEYHAAAAAVANFPIASFAIAQRLFESAGVPFDAARPLVDAIVANVFDIGPLHALTGPIARGDTGTVAAQISAVRAVAPDLAGAFESMVDATSAVAATSHEEDTP